MRLSDTLTDEAIVTGTTWPDFDSVLGALIALLVASGRLPSGLERKALAAVREREQLASTEMVDIGVSIPHTRLEGIERITSALAIAPAAVYGADSGTPISIVALVLSPPALTGEHLNVLSSFSLLLHSNTTRRRLQTADSPEVVMALIREHEGR